MTSITADLPLFAKPAPRRPGFHPSRLAYSPGSQRMLALLLGTAPGGWFSTRGIIEGAHICAVNSYAANLRHVLNGIPVDCETTDRVAYYRLRDRDAAISRALDIVPAARMGAELKKAIYG